MSEPKSDNHIARTKGEELFLVHLTRYQPSPDDFDRDKGSSDGGVKKVRSMSAGEELWEIHCRRSRGREEEEEEEKEVETLEEKVTAKPQQVPAKKPRTVKSSAVVKTPINAATVSPIRNLSLRNREIAIS